MDRIVLVVGSLVGGGCVSREDPRGLLKEYGIGTKRSCYLVLDILCRLGTDLLVPVVGLQQEQPSTEKLIQ